MDVPTDKGANSYKLKISKMAKIWMIVLTIKILFM